MRILFFLVLLAIAGPVFGQTRDTVYYLTEVEKLALAERNGEHLPKLSYRPDSTRKNAANNLSDYLCSIPGVYQITTGNAISKPVIHGLFGNRILPVINGLRYDAQQWQDEHGLGLSQTGIRTVDVVTSGASSLFGSEAIGGAILVSDERADSGVQALDATVRLHSNTLGTLTDVGYSNGKRRVLWNIRGGVESHSDYADGGGNRVLNSRGNGYYLKAGFGFHKKNWSQYNYYDLAYNQYGFILDGLGTFFAPDNRYARNMAGPHHNVLLNFFSSRNEFRLGGKSRLSINAGLQSNKRAEDEGGGSISLDIHLLSLIENAAFRRQLGGGLSLVAYESGLYQNNANYGKRILIPDATVLEINGSAGLSYRRNLWEAALLLGGDTKRIATQKSGTLNPYGSEVAPFSANKSTATGAAQASWYPSKSVRINIDLSTGYRAPNLAELSTNGVHEGTFQYEIGDPQLRPEQAFNTSLTLDYAGAAGRRMGITFHATGYRYRFQDYIYLAPTGETRFGLFQVFRYRQQQADLNGCDGTLIFALQNRAKTSVTTELKLTGSYIQGSTADGAYLPFMPPPKLSSRIHRFFPDAVGIHRGFIALSCDYFFPQSHPAAFETSTADYALFHFDAGADIGRKNSGLSLGLNIRNLLNKRYVDHLSRLKYYGLYNQGINAVITVSKTMHY